jgi:hypothetical protein
MYVGIIADGYARNKRDNYPYERSVFPEWDMKFAHACKLRICVHEQMAKTPK